MTDHSSPANETPPRFYIVNQHIGWLKQYILGMDEKNWRDMQLRAERQLESLSEEIDKEEAALGIRAKEPYRFASGPPPCREGKTMTNDYLITTEPGEHHDLSLSWSADRNLIFLHTNGRTTTFSPSMAQETLRGLMAILTGGFDRALSEGALHLEQVRASRASNHYAPTAATTTPSLKPELDDL